MKFRQKKSQGTPITITAERLSDHSRMTFTVSSDQTIEQLRTLLNLHLPPQRANEFLLYSYQRGALIHFHPSSFKLDYFPVIFDQSVLLLQMDDRIWNEMYRTHQKCFPPTKVNSHHNFPSLRSRSSSKTITCFALLKRIFQRSSYNVDSYRHSQKTVLTY